jgi:glycosyltransferase involved in cell wall biosynthesis
MSDVEPGDGDLERDLAEQWQRVQKRGSYSAALSAPSTRSRSAHFRIPEVPASSKVPGGGTIHTVVGKTVTRHLTDLCAQLDDFAVGPSCSGGDRRRARRPCPPEVQSRLDDVADQLACCGELNGLARIGVTEQRERLPLVWIGSLGPGDGAERVIAAFDLVCTYDDPLAGLVMAGPAPDPRHLAAARYRDELKLFGLRFIPTRRRQSVLPSAISVPRGRGLTIASSTSSLAYGPQAEAPRAHAARSRAHGSEWARGRGRHVVRGQLPRVGQRLAAGTPPRTASRCIGCRSSARATSSGSRRSRCALTGRLVAPSQHAWLDEQGPRLDGLADVLRDRAKSADVAVVLPYLYLPAFTAITTLAGRVPIVVPPVCARRAASASRCTSGSSASPTRSASSPRKRPRSCGAGSHRPTVSGHGHRSRRRHPTRRRRIDGVGERPYLVCVGRIDPGKGTLELVEWFGRYKARIPGRCLVLVGDRERGRAIPTCSSRAS